VSFDAKHAKHSLTKFKTLIMIALNIELYKYGSFKEKDVYEFDNEAEAVSLLRMQKIIQISYKWNLKHAENL
jgi:hypothetical protein